MTEQIAREIYDECNKLAPGKYCMLWCIRTNVQPGENVMDFFATKQRAERVLAEAFCLEAYSLKLAANFYFKVKRPIVPGKAFDKEVDALEWLAHHVK